MEGAGGVMLPAFGACAWKRSVGGDADGLSEGVAAKAGGRDRNELKGDLHADGGVMELGGVEAGQVVYHAAEAGEQGNLAEIFGTWLGHTGGEWARDKNLDGVGFALRDDCPGCSRE